MPRAIILFFSLAVCLLRFGDNYLQKTTSNALEDPLAPISTYSISRFKKPVPFQNISLQKKKLSSPPVECTNSCIKIGLFLDQPIAVWSVISGIFIEDDYSGFAAQWEPAKVKNQTQGNIFHPPPQS